MNLTRLASIVAVLALVVSIATLVRQTLVNQRIVDLFCQGEEQRCNFDCAVTLREKSSGILTARGNELGLHTERLLACPNVDVRAATQCRTEEIARHRKVMADLEALQAAADRGFIMCRATCSNKVLACRGEDPQAALAGQANREAPTPIP